MDPENFALIRPTVQELRHFFEVTDARAQKLITSVPIQNFFFCIYMRGKEGNSTNPIKFLLLHFVKDNSIFLSYCFFDFGSYLKITNIVEQTIIKQKGQLIKKLQITKKDLHLILTKNLNSAPNVFLVLKWYG